MEWSVWPREVLVIQWIRGCGLVLHIPPRREEGEQDEGCDEVTHVVSCGTMCSTAR